MAVNSAFSIEKLTGRDNYATWKFAVKAYMEHEDLWTCVTGENVDSVKDIKAKSKLILLVDSINYVHIQDAKTSKEVWLNLERAFDDNGLTRKVALLKDLITTSLESSKSVEDYVNIIMTTAHKLRNIGFSVDDEWLGTLMLAGLPDKYKPMIMAIESSGVKISADIIKTKLLQEVSSETTAFYSFKKNNSQPKQNYVKGPRCFNCNRFGHLSKYCRAQKKTSCKQSDDKGFVAAFSASCATIGSDSNKWYLDSGASMHMTNRSDWLYDVTNPPISSITVANNSSLPVQGIGKVNMVLDGDVEKKIQVDKKEDTLAGGHPFFLKGEEWKNSRNQVTPSLSLAKLKGYLPNIFKVGDEMVKYVKQHCNGTAELETREVATMYSTDVIANAIYGVANNSFENKDSLFVHLTKEIEIENSITSNIKLFFQHLPIINWLFPARFAPRKLQDMMVAVTSRILKERVASGEKRNDLIQLLLTQKKNDMKGVYTETYMSGQVFIVVVDLYETASTAISIFLYMISRYPEIQEKLRAEIREIQTKNNGETTVEDIEGAKYLAMVYKESFRLFSFVLSRECTTTCYVPIPGSDKPFKITKGTPIVIPASAIHKDPKYYPDPEKFDPERFTEEEVAKRPRFTYMPFGEGPKKCIGTRIVGLHVKAAVIKILDNFKLTPSPKTKYPFEFDERLQLTLRPKDGAWVIFEPINK